MDIKMIDLPLIINPLYHMEILTLSEDYKTILYGTVFDPVNNPQSFPTNFVGRIYTNGNSVGTGFVYLKNHGISQHLVSCFRLLIQLLQTRILATKLTS